LSAALARTDQAEPSGEVITLLPDPEEATAQNNLSSRDQATEDQEAETAAAFVAHATPSVEV
jgi:hypothetical protein